MSALDATERQAAVDLREIAGREHQFLASVMNQDGFQLSAIEESEGTDELFHVWFAVEMVGKRVSFKYSLGYDHDTKLYQPHVDVVGGDDANPAEFEYRYAATDPGAEDDLICALEQLACECGEARFVAFKWLEGLAPRQTP